MRRADLVRHLSAHGCELFREGGRHSIWWNPANRKTSAVPRHAEIVDPVANRICKDLGIPPPATTWVGVAALADPGFLIEVEAIAVVD